MNEAARPPRVFYYAGPGDVAGTYRHWKAGTEDPHEVAIAYSAEFYSFCRELNARALVYSTNARRETIRDGQFHIIQRPSRIGRGRLSFHLFSAWLTLKLMMAAIWFRADVVLIGPAAHYFLLAPLSWMGVRVVTSLHCAFWPAGHRPTSFGQRVIDCLNGWFFRRLAGAVLAHSPESERQVRELAGTLNGGFYPFRPQYHEADFTALHAAPPHSERPFRILFAGRLEKTKGIYDLLTIISLLHTRAPGRYAWEICGTGSEAQRVAEMIAASGLSDHVQLRGKLNRPAMTQAYCRSHAVIVPTNSSGSFAEGLNKVVVEAILSRRPVISSRLCNAIDVAKGAIVEVPPGDCVAYADAIQRLADDAALYSRVVQCGIEASRQFYDRENSFSRVLLRQMDDLRPIPQSKSTPVAASAVDTAAI